MEGNRFDTLHQHVATLHTFATARGDTTVLTRCGHVVNALGHPTRIAICTRGHTLSAQHFML